MCQVLRSNFEESLEKIKGNIQKASFYAIDTEFTGLKLSEDDRPNLFDSGAERYQKLRLSMSQFTICQIGIAFYVPMPEQNRFEVSVYNMDLYPASFGPLDTKFLCQASSLEFLCKHNFDFNRFVYEGVPYLSDVQEAVLRQHLDSQVHCNGFDREADERFVQECCSQAAEWLPSAAEGQTLCFPIGNDISTTYCLVSELRSRFPTVWANEQGQNVVVERITAEARNEREEKHKSEEEDRLIESLLGFTHVFRALVKSKLPMLGHNSFTDLVLMYDKFYRPLPDSYSQFKADIHRMFPVIFDTKHMASTLRRPLEKTRLLEDSDLGRLYKSLDSKEGRLHVLLQPSIKFMAGFDQYDGVHIPHEAGYDAYMCGYVFIRLMHILANQNVSSTDAQPLTLKDYFISAQPYKNSVNLIRASINHVTFGGQDPQSIRPQWLHVSSHKPLNSNELVQLFSSHGTIDVNFLDSRSALVAVGNFRSFKEILAAFRGHSTIKVARYSVWKHSRLLRALLWSGAAVSGSVCVWALYDCLKQKA